MSTEPDFVLLRGYAEAGDQAAFRELVQRRIDGVYSAAVRRMNGDRHLAHDVTQQVFIALARKARTLTGHPDLLGWLYTTTRLEAANVRRAEQRRRQREQKAALMPDEPTAPPPDWSRVSPVLDDAIEQLNPADRTAILLRFVERRPFADIGAQIDVSEDAARMRVDRALDRLRDVLARRGIASPLAALGAALQAHAGLAAPASLAPIVAQAALLGAKTGALIGLGELLFMTKLKSTLVAVAVVSLGTVVAWRDLRAIRGLQGEIRAFAAQEQAVAGLRRANDQINRRLATIAPASPAAAELAQLQQRIAVLKQRPAGVTDAALRPTETLAHRGWDTPSAAFETQMWARLAGSPDDFAQVYGFTRRGQASVAEFFAALPASFRAQHRTPERMLAVNDAPYPSPGLRPVAIQLLREEAYGDKRIVRAWARLADGREVDHTMLFEKHDDGWRVPFTDEATERALAALDPKTGLRRPADSKQP